MTVISFVNHKGGVGKTTSAVNLSAALAKLGKKILLIDFDPQANSTIHLGMGADDGLEKNRNFKNIYGNITDQYEPEPINIADNFDLIPSHLDLSGAEMELINENAREYFLKDVVDKLKDSYDVVFIDCPPSLGILTVNAMTASDKIYIPIEAQFFAMKGMQTILGSIEKMRKRLNKKLDLGGVIITKIDKRKNVQKAVIDAIRNNFKEKVFNTGIGLNVAIEEAPTEGLTIIDYSNDSTGSIDYIKLAHEIIKREEI